MLPAVLTIVGVGIALLVVGYCLAVRLHRNPAPASAHGETGRGVAGPHWLPKGSGVGAEREARGGQTRLQVPAVIPGLTKQQAEEALDWLESNGYPPYEVAYDPASGFTLRQK